MEELKTCIVIGCQRKYHARGLCKLHYMRKWKTGEIFSEIPPKKKMDIAGMKFGRLLVMKESHTDRHGQSYWECVCDCGSNRIVRGSALWNNKTKSCGCWVADYRKSQTGEKSNNWKGGRRILNGYILLKRNGHPNADGCGYIAEHRLLMSEYIGRPLTDSEIVYHKNKIRTDNRIENLELLTDETHYGHVICPHCEKEFLIK